MTRPFKGVINVDTRDSTPDWAPYVQPVAPERAPNVLYIVLDDVGFSAMEPWAGKDRFIETPSGEPGLNYLCAGYKAFFHHVDRSMRFMSDQLRRGGAPAEIMRVFAAEDARRCRNDPCSCGSGRKGKRCHGAALGV